MSLDAVLTSFANGGMANECTSQEVEGALGVLIAPVVKKPVSVAAAETLRTLRFLVASRIQPRCPSDLSETAVALMHQLLNATVQSAPRLPSDAKAWVNPNPALTSACRLLLQLASIGSGGSSAIATAMPLRLRAALTVHGDRLSPAMAVKAMDDAVGVVHASHSPQDPAARRCAAVVVPHAAADVAIMELLNVDAAGVKPLLGSAPIAITLAGSKASDFSIGDRIAAATAEQTHHAYVVSMAMGLLRIASGGIPDGIAPDVFDMIRHYIDRVDARLVELFANVNAPVAVMATSSAPSLDYVAALFMFVLQARHFLVCISDLVGHSKVSDRVSAARFFGDAMDARRTREGNKVMTDGAPEFRSFDFNIARTTKTSISPSTSMANVPSHLQSSSLASTGSSYATAPLLPPLACVYSAALTGETVSGSTLASGSGSNATQQRIRSPTREEPRSVAHEAAMITAVSSLVGGVANFIPTPGAAAHVAAAISLMNTTSAESVSQELLSQLFILASEQPHTSVPLIKTAISVALAAGGVWTSDCLLRICFFPLMAAAAECELICDTGVPAPTTVAAFFNALGNPANVHWLPNKAMNLSQAPAAEVSVAWADLVAFLSPMSFRMKAAARCIVPLLQEFGRAIPDGAALPVDFLAHVLTAMRFLLAPRHMHSECIETLRLIAKRILLNAPLATLESAVPAAVELLSLGASMLQLTQEFSDIVSWTISTMSVVLSARNCDELTAPTSSFFDKLHELTWNIVNILPPQDTSIAARAERDADHWTDFNEDPSTSLSNMLPDGYMTATSSVQPIPIDRGDTIGTRSTPATQLLHCCVTSMATLATIDAAFVEKSLVCVGAVWRATQTSCPNVAEACVACVAVCGRGVHRTGLPNLETLFGLA
jgi:hypothetical protein